MTIEEIMGLPLRAIIHHKSNKNADGTPQRWRVNGRCRTWKTRPGDFHLPIKHGLYDFGSVTQDNAKDFELP